MAVVSRHERVPVERSEQRPRRDRANVGAEIARAPRGVPALHEPADLIFARAAEMEAREDSWTLGAALGALAAATVATALVSEVLVHSLDAFARAAGLWTTMDTIFDILTGIGLALAAGIRPFLPALAAGAMASANALIDFDHTDLSFLESPGWLLEIVVVLIVIVVLQRRGESSSVDDLAVIHRLWTNLWM